MSGFGVGRVFSSRQFGNTCVFGLYRDDGLGISHASSRQTELIKKDL